MSRAQAEPQNVGAAACLPSSQAFLTTPRGLAQPSFPGLIPDLITAFPDSSLPSALPACSLSAPACPYCVPQAANALTADHISSLLFNSSPLLTGPHPTFNHDTAVHQGAALLSPAAWLSLVPHEGRVNSVTPDAPCSLSSWVLACADLLPGLTVIPCHHLERCYSSFTSPFKVPLHCEASPGFCAH